MTYPIWQQTILPAILEVALSPHFDELYPNSPFSWSGDDPLFPLKTYFQLLLLDHKFVEKSKSLIDGVGVPFEFAFCIFPEDLDDSEEPLEGVLFSLYSMAEDEHYEVIVDRPTFVHYLRLACSERVRKHPNDEGRIRELLRDAEREGRL